MPFPRDRYTRAGASAAQLSELQDAYERLSQEAQESYDQRLAPLSDYQIVSELAGLPESAPDAVAVEEEPVEEPAAAPPAPPASRGQASSSPFPSQPSSSGSESAK